MISVPASVGSVLSRTSAGERGAVAAQPGRRGPVPVAPGTARRRSSAAVSAARSARRSSGTSVSTWRPTSSSARVPEHPDGLRVRHHDRAVPGHAEHRVRRQVEQAPQALLGSFPLGQGGHQPGPHQLDAAAQARRAPAGRPSGMACWYVPSATAATASSAARTAGAAPRQTPMITSAAMAATTTIIAMSAPSSASCARSSASVTDCCSPVICDCQRQPRRPDGEHVGADVGGVRLQRPRGRRRHPAAAPRPAGPRPGQPGLVGRRHGAEPRRHRRVAAGVARRPGRRAAGRGSRGVGRRQGRLRCPSVTAVRSGPAGRRAWLSRSSARGGRGHEPPCRVR